MPSTLPLSLITSAAVVLSLAGCPGDNGSGPPDPEACSDVVVHEQLTFSASAMFPFDPEDPSANQFPLGRTSGTFLSQDGPVVFEDSEGRSWDIQGVAPAGTVMGSGLVWPDFVAMGEVEIETMTDWGGDECWDPVGLLVLHDGEVVFEASSLGASPESSLEVNQVVDGGACLSDEAGRSHVPLSVSVDGEEVAQLLPGSVTTAAGFTVAAHSSSVGEMERDEDGCRTAELNWVAVSQLL